MKEILFDLKKEHTTLPLNYYYLTEFPLSVDEDVKITTVPKDAFNSRASILAHFYKPISIDFPEENRE